MALRAVDEAADGVIAQIRRQARQEALATILGDSQYRAGVEMGLRMDWPEDAIFDAVAQAAEINEDDPYFAFEDAFGFDQRLLDRRNAGEEA